MRVDFQVTAVILSGLLIVTGLGMIYVERWVAASRQHRFAFLAITVLVVSMLPRAIHTPEILLSCGMILFALHLSTYYSGTSQNSGRLYGLILMLAGIIPVLNAFPALYHQPFGRFLLSGLVWLLMDQLETQISRQLRYRNRMETILLWVWFVSAIMSLLEPGLQLLPDLIFILLLIVHIEKAWGSRHIPAPMVIFYALIVSWNLHFIFALGFLSVSQGALGEQEQRSLTLIAGVLLLWRIWATKSLSKRFMYYFMIQELILLHFELSNWFISVSHFFDIIRFLLFSALIGLFVMIESRPSQGLERKLLVGLGHERKRLTVFMLSLVLLLSLYPLAYWWKTGMHPLPMLGLFSIGIILLGDSLRVSFKPSHRSYRIIRPSLSIWSTVIMTIAWGTILLISTMVKG